MLTRCPQCETLYRLTTEQLEAAGGKVRCSRCNKVFNAAEHMQQSSKKAPIPSVRPKPKPKPQPTPAPKPDTSKETEPLAQPNPLPKHSRPTEPTTPDVLLQPTRTEPGVIWWALAILLTAVAAVQLAWLDRNSLIKDPQGKEFLTTLCDLVGCSLPQPKDPSKFRVLSRDMSSHPVQRNALLFRLVMANKANYAQPYPYLQLKLFDNNRRPAGHRIFAPKEYLSEEPVTGPAQPDQAVYIRLELLDPGPDISGFEIKFL